VRIKQARVSPWTGFFIGKFHKHHGFDDYSDKSAPAVFMGCYGARDRFAIARHSSDIILVWGGTDVVITEKFGRNHPYNDVLFRKNVFHIAKSNFISNTLSRMGIKHFKVPVCSTVAGLFNPVPRGDKVYSYIPERSKKKYGHDIFIKVKEQLPDIDFVIADGIKSVPFEEMVNMYSKCFIGLRLVEHDGISNTVVELGLMGRRVVWNGDTPNAIPYENIEDIVRAIKKEKNRVDDNQLVSSAVRNHIDIGDDWKDTSFYRKERDDTDSGTINELLAREAVA